MKTTVEFVLRNDEKPRCNCGNANCKCNNCTCGDGCVGQGCTCGCNCCK